MKVNTALIMILLAISLIFLNTKTKINSNWFSAVVSVLVILFASLTICEYAFHINPGIDQLFFNETGLPLASNPPGRMGLNTAICFVLLGIAVLSTSLNPQKAKLIIVFFIGATGTCALLSLLGHIVGFHELSTVGEFTKMSLPTSLSFIAISLGITIFLAVNDQLGFLAEHAFFGGLTSILIVMILITIAMVSNMQDVIDSSDWVKHTYTIKTNLDKSLYYSTDMTKNILHYQISQDTALISSYRTSRDSLSGQIIAIENLTKDNPAQQRLASSLKSIIGEKIHIADSIFGLRINSSLLSNSIEKLLKFEYKNDSIVKAIIAEMNKHESKLLQTRVNDLNIKTVHAEWLIFVAAIIQTLLGIFVIYLVRRALARRKRSEKILHELNLNLEEKINERTAELAETNAVLKNEIEIRKQSEMEIIELNATLEHKVADRTMQLEQTNKELEAFSYSVSHDLRAPLRHIDGYIELVIKKTDSQLEPKIQRYLQIIAESAQKMGRLIDDLLTFSRLGRSELNKQKIDIKHIFNSVIESFQDDIKKRNINVVIEGNFPEVYADKNLMELVIVNLISNAVKYTQNVESPQITVGSEGNENETTFYVKDNGAGFDMKYADKLFGVFQRLHRSEDFEGIGIGLANVRRIVTKHGGKTWAYGEVDKGATLYFTLDNYIK